MKKWARGPVLVILSCVASLAFVWVVGGGWLDERGTLVVDNLGQLAAASLATVACAWRCVVLPRGSIRRSWAMLSLGAGFWAAGQIAWTVYEVVLGVEVPFPSVADVGFLLSPLAFGAGAVSWLRHGRTVAARMRDLLDGALTAGALLVLSWVTTLGAVYATSDRGTLALALGLAYPIADVLIASLVLLALGRTAIAQRTTVWFLAAGLLSLAVADSAYVYLVSAGRYGSGNALDAGWVFGFLLIAAGATVGGDRSGAGPGVEPQKTRSGAVVPSRLSLVLPYLPMVAAGATIAVDLLRVPHIPVFELVMAVALVSLVLGRQFLATTENRRLLGQLSAVHEQLRHQAMHDPLTGAANRSLFADRLQHALALRHDGGGHALAVLFCDVDNFKDVNDQHGHAAGDATLCIVADQIRGCLRPGDTLARLGGDEFAVLLENVEEPMRAAQRLVQAVAGVSSVEGFLEGSGVTLSVGLAVSRSVTHRLEPAEEAQLLLRRADTAMYLAKAGGKNRAVQAPDVDQLSATLAQRPSSLSPTAIPGTSRQAPAPTPVAAKTARELERSFTRTLH